MISNLDRIFFYSALIISIGKTRLSQTKGLRKAFTLAEVLMTLTVIGVVGAIVIPPVYHNIQDAQYRTMWKATFSDLTQVTIKIKTDNGGSLKNVFVGTFVHDAVRDKFSSYMNYLKTCKQFTCGGNLWHSNNSAKWLKGTNMTTHGGESTVVLNNGVTLAFLNYGSACDTTVYGKSNLCADVIVDVNGVTKGPNVVGRDIFRAFILENSIAPAGVRDNFVGSCISSSYGIGCSAKYLKE
ncbi:MAG: type II secretion system protein [bacterium]